MALQIVDRVRETTTTTGTGAVTLAGAATGFRAFSAVCSVGDTFYYTLQGVDGSGNLTAVWEVGIGTYSATNTLTRTAVLASSAGGTTAATLAGTTQVWLDWSAAAIIAALPPYPKPTGTGTTTSFYRHPLPASTAWTNLALSANTARVVPLRIPTACTISPVINVTTAVTGDILFSLYAVDTSTGLPGVKIFDFTPISTAATGKIQSTSSLAIPAGDYYIFYNPSAAPTVLASQAPSSGFADGGMPLVEVSGVPQAIGRLDFNFTYTGVGPSTLVGQTYTAIQFPVQAVVPRFVVT